MKVQRILQARKEGKDGRVWYIVLVHTNCHEFVTWDYFEDTGYSSGHYHVDFFDGMNDFRKRVEGCFGMNYRIEYCARQIGVEKVTWEELN